MTTLSTRCDRVPLSALGIRQNEHLGECRPARPFNLRMTEHLMKKLIAVITAGLFSVAGAFADEMKKEEKKAEAKPAAGMAKPAAETKKTEAKKADAKPAVAMKKDEKKADKKAEMKKDEMKKDDAKK